MCSSELEACNHNMLLYRKDFCYSARLADDYMVKGCLFEASAELQRMCNPMDAHRDNCVTCQYDGCNRDMSPDARTKCMVSDAGGAGVDCKSYKVSSRRGCFARETEGRLVLGCNTQRTDEDFEHCANIANDTCQLCMTSMCNKLEQGR